MTDQELAFWTDSHCHLAMEEFDADRSTVLERAEEARVRRMLAVGTTPEDWPACAALADGKRLWATAGLHPHEASRWDAAVAKALGEALSRRWVVAVGEIGLDYHYDLSPRAVQRAAFEAQVARAVERGLPVVVHSRKAFEDTVAVLRGAGAALAGVIHCFTYGPREAEILLGLGLHLSFSGIATFPRAPEIREAAALTPSDRMLVETDAPYLAPVPYRGKRCEPAHVADVGRHLAGHLGLDVLEFARLTSDNAARLFGWGPLDSE
ncbi:MAG: TatD family hydrolase [Acidobacteriota bacterium]